MSDSISGKGPGREGTEVGGQIKSPMMSQNVDRQNTPSTKDYKTAASSGGGKGGSGNSIMGPGDEGKYPRKK